MKRRIIELEKEIVEITQLGNDTMKIVLKNESKYLDSLKWNWRLLKTVEKFMGGIIE